ncbi:MAG: magnesium transporter CorA family protein [Caldilineaceae bacterium]|nr:magnesium transporter CorA family protein [Caldilineaceae bacterium]
MKPLRSRFVFTIYNSTPQGLTQIETIAPGCWIHAVNPEPAEIARLRDEFGVPESFIAASLDLDELARIDEEDGYSLVIVLVPHAYSEDPTDVPYSTTPLGIILTKEHLITISRIHTNFVSEFTRRHMRQVSTSKHHRLILQIFLAISQHYINFLRQIEVKTDDIRRRLQVSLKNKELLELLLYQKSYIYFRTSLESNGLMMRRLQRSQIFEMYPDDLNLLEDVLTENAQATEVTKISSDILNQMMDAYASIISNNLNDVMKILAVATIVLAIPTLIASLYGMNVDLPGQNSPFAFAGIVVLLLVLVMISGIIFRRLKWL